MQRRSAPTCSDGGFPRLDCRVHACFLDVDGTLLELAASPTEVRVDASLLALLDAVMRACGGALALISGRTIAEIDGLFAPLRLPMAGQHGLERRDARGTVHRNGSQESEVPRMIALARAWTASRKGLLVEDKGGTFAVHYRSAPGYAEEVLAFMRVLAQRGAGGYRLQPGKMVVELTPEGHDKASAIAAFMGEPPFAGRTPVFVGDDATDERAFPFIEESGGIAIKVGDGETSARWRLSDVAAVHEWIGSGVAVYERGR